MIGMGFEVANVTLHGHSRTKNKRAVLDAIQTCYHGLQARPAKYGTTLLANKSFQFRDPVQYNLRLCRVTVGVEPLRPQWYAGNASAECRLRIGVDAIDCLPVEVSGLFGRTEGAFL